MMSLAHGMGMHTGGRIRRSHASEVARVFSPKVFVGDKTVLFQLRCDLKLRDLASANDVQ